MRAYCDLDKACQTFTWTPKVCKMTAFMAIIMGLGLSFCILFGVQVLKKQNKKCKIMAFMASIMGSGLFCYILFWGLGTEEEQEVF